MFYADRVGLAAIRDRLKEIAARANNDSLMPAPLLSRLAAEGKTFGSLASAQ